MHVYISQDRTRPVCWTINEMGGAFTKLLECEEVTSILTVPEQTEITYIVYLLDPSIPSFKYQH